MNYRGKNVLVTGADGFIGSHLAEALTQNGAKVTALALYNAFGGHGWLDEPSDDVPSRMTRSRGDLRDAAFMNRLIEGQDFVFHLGALIAIPHSYDAPQSYLDTNIAGTLNVLEAARRHGVGRLIHTSTSEVYGTAQAKPIAEDHPLQGQSPYSATKIGADMMAEAFARSFDLPVVILRPFNTYGPRQSERAVIPTVIRQALDPDCESIKVGDVTPTRDFNYVADTVDAFLAIGSADGADYGKAYNAGTGVEVSIEEVIKKICDLTGANKPVERDPERLRPENSEVKALVADSSRLREATGWTPKVDLSEGLGRTIDWWRGRVASGAVRPDSAYLT